MPESMSTDLDTVRLLPIAMPAAAIPAPGEWHGRGLCIGADPDIFFTAHGATGTQAKQICAACAVREECLEYATDADEVGIWGGLDQARSALFARLEREIDPQGKLPPAAVPAT